MLLFYSSPNVSLGIHDYMQEGRDLEDVEKRGHGSLPVAGVCLIVPDPDDKWNGGQCRKRHEMACIAHCLRVESQSLSRNRNTGLGWHFGCYLGYIARRYCNPLNGHNHRTNERRQGTQRNHHQGPEHSGGEAY